MHFETTRLLMRPMQADDLEDNLIYALDPAVNQYVPFPLDRAFAMKRFEASLEPWQGETNDKLVLAIVNKNSQQVIGELMFKYASKNCGLVEIGYCLNTASQGKGYATEAVKALIRHAFEQCGAHKIWAKVDTRNDASNRLLEKLGMRKEGCLIEQTKLLDGWCDMYSWGLVVGEAAER
jgi:ribosomal-protein-alanine N-acetyltransferase